MAKSHVESLLEKLPQTPGVYKMKDEEGRILYVGKAKNLSRRVRSYFRKQNNRPMRTQKLVDCIADLEWIEVGSDLEALFLETNLIKEYRPKYNVLMKDDKNYIYIKITKEDFPQIQLVRRVDKDGARYFGPKTATGNVRKTLMLLQKLFMYRSCDLGITWSPDAEVPEKGIATVTKKTIAYPCLDYHIKRCAAPCIGKITPTEYKKSIDKITLFLEGKSNEIEKQLKEQMAACVTEKQFEKAALLRDKILALQDLMVPSKQVVTSPEQDSMDVFAFVLEGGKAYFNLFMLREGKLINQENFIADAFGFEPGEEEQAVEVMEAFLYQYYGKATDFPQTILIPHEFEETDFLEDFLTSQADRRVYVKVPERGRKHQLLELAEKNARSFQKQHKARWEGFEERDDEAMEELAKCLNLPKKPKRMECYDISHLGGSDTVASMVVFENGKSKKSDYRKFHLKSIAEGEIDDFKSMKEILHRRLAYLYRTPEGITVRKAAKTHKIGIEELLTEWRKEPQVVGDELSEYTVALRDKKVVGLIRLSRCAPECFLQKSLYVLESEREKGIAKALMRCAYDHLKAKRVYLSCDDDTAQFYKDFGFEEIKTLPDSCLEQLESEPYMSVKKHRLAYNPAKHHDASFESKPDLIVIDGGKGQLSHAQESAKEVGCTIPMIGLAKREEEVFVPEKSFPILMPNDSKASFLLQRIRNEAHRFAITFQRSTRKAHLTESALDQIKGLGDVGKMKLLEYFGSVEQIKKASEADIASVVGKSLATKILQGLPAPEPEADDLEDLTDNA